MKYTIAIAQESKKWCLYKEITPELFKVILSKIIENYPNFCKVKNIEISILLTNDQKVKKLNKKFRNRNAKTNVLSFPDLDIDYEHILEFKTDSNYMYLGDIAFSFEKIYQEAKIEKIAFLNHFKHLLVHSILHLLGYNHINDIETKVMQDIEIKVLKNLKVPSPYL